MIISLLNQKGGVGKTTLATNISAGLASQGEKVLLVDADPQHSALDWGAKRETPLPFTLLGLPTAVLHRDLPAMVGNPFSFIVIDGPGKLTDVPRSAIMASDLVLIPVQPSPYDVWAAQDLLNILKEAQVYRPNVKAAFIINSKRENSNLGREVAEVVREFAFPVLDTHIHRRDCYASTAGRGISVLEMKPSTESEKSAVDEIKNVVQEIVRLING